MAASNRSSLLPSEQTSDSTGLRYSTRVVDRHTSRVGVLAIPDRDPL